MSLSFAPTWGRLRPLAISLLVLTALAGTNHWVSAQAVDEHPFPTKYPAPALDGGFGWLNTGGPIDLRQLRGKWVVLDFWTYCCINCQHVLPQLARLERAYPNEVVVIGIHSGKFMNEKDTEQIVKAIQRHDIRHPVINDAEMKIWDKFGAQSWPTIAIIDPEGFVVTKKGGEVEFEALDAYFKRNMTYYDRKGLLDRTPLRFELAAFSAPATPLRYPSKILADERSNRLFISDTAHHRIVVTTLDGKLLEVIGSGQLGAADGTYDKCSFDNPHGTALLGNNILFVADTENHLLRRVDLNRKRVTTVAGTGKQADEWPGQKEFVASLGARNAPFRFVGPPLKTALNSPWALSVIGADLYIAMAGPHQIWKMPRATAPTEIGPFAGNGVESIVDGMHLPFQPFELGFSSFAQPSGLSNDGSNLFVADSEGSSIRSVPIDSSKPVSTIVGTSWIEPPPRRLFVAGDVDGNGQQVLLQHPLDVLYHDGTVFVADTYNHKIKVLDPNRAICRTLAGSGKAGAGNDPAEFDEPEGLAFANGKLYVADTNNHAIRVIEPATGKVTTLTISGLDPPKALEPLKKPDFSQAPRIELTKASLKPVDGKVRLQVALELPANFKIDALAPLRYYIESTAQKGAIDSGALEKLTEVADKGANFEIELTAAASGEDKLTVSLVFYYCQTGSEGICKTGNVSWVVPVSLSSNAPGDSVKLPYKVR